MSELEQSIHDYFEGKLSPEKREELVQLFKQDPELQNELVDLTITERLLNTLKDGSMSATEVIETLRMEKQTEPIAPYIRSNLEQQKQSQKFKVWRDIALIAASVMVIFFGWQQISLNKQQMNPTKLSVSQSIGAMWEGNHPQDNQLTPGEWRLKSGILKLSSEDGSQFILEGPANFVIHPDQNWQFNSGRVFADIHQNDRNFKLQTPHAEFSDMGQKFAMEVFPDKATHFQMLEGQGNWASQGTEGQLPQRQWVSFSKGQLANTLSHSNYRYLSTLPQTNIGNYTMHHWTFDQPDGNQFHDFVSDRNGISYPATWTELSDTPTGPVRVNGQFGDAIQLNGTSQYLKTDWEGIAGTKARTVCFWVKVPKDFKKSQGYGIVTWGTTSLPGSTIQISINPDERFGKEYLGRLRVGVYDGEAIGTSDLRDQRWHHCAVVMYEGADARTDTHFILYVDGQVEKTIGRPYQINTNIDNEKAVKVQFGRNHHSKNFFRGWIDEVSIIDKALEDWEVRSLMKYNRIIKEDEDLAL